MGKVKTEYYQPKKLNSICNYKIPPYLYRAVTNMVRYRYLELSEGLNMYKADDTYQDPTAYEAIWKVGDDDLKEQCDKAWDAIPEAFREPVKKSLLREQKVLNLAEEYYTNTTTLSLYKRLYLFHVLKNMGRI